jgi:hypothetical protein
MNLDKFKNEISILKRFFELHCHHKHTQLTHHCKHIVYKDEKINIELELCDDCITLIDYSLNRLLECPFDPKPMCRSCSNPCYEKNQWKKVAKLMRYSGMQLGVLKVRKFITKIFKS